MSKTVKKVLSILLCAALLFSAAPLNGFAGLRLPELSALFAPVAHAADPSGTCGVNLTWNYDTSTNTLTISGTGAMNSYFDSSYNGTYVTSAPWRPYYKTMQTLVINSGVTSIGDFAFYGCTGLTSVTIPNSVTSIGEYAFSGCSGLTKVNITDLTAWCNISFSNYSSNPLYFAHNLYLNDELVTDLIIPDSVTSIGNYAFYECTGLTSVTIPDSVTSIGNWAFDYCTSLTAISVSEGNPNYSSDSFGVLYNKNKTELIQYPNGNTRTSFTIPDSVTSIGNYAFRGCTGLTSVTIGNSVTSIGSSAFSGCTGLTSVTIPDSVTRIGNSAFSGCTGLTSVTIPNSVTSIGNYAFYYCTGLTSVTIGNSVTSIGKYAFYYCTGLTSVTIGNSVTSIGYEAFYYCTGLTSVIIPDSVTSIDDYAFEYCTGLTSVTIPDSVTSIGTNAFNNCSNLAKVLFTSLTMEYRFPSQAVIYCYSNSNEYPVALENGNPVVLLDEVIAPSGAMPVNEEKKLISGVESDSADFASAFTLAEGYSVAAPDASTRVGTGDEIQIQDADGFTIATYEAVVFGDVDGNSWYDGTDAYFVKLVANGLISADALTDAQRMAADCNHDGVIDNADTALLEQAGLLLANVDQSAPQEELQTNGAYLEYCSLIDQTIEIAEPAAEEPQQPTQSAAGLWQSFLTLFRRLINYITLKLAIIIIPR